MTDPLNTTDREISAYADARKYRRAFWITLVIAVAFAVLTIGIWWRIRRKPTTMQGTATGAASTNTETQPAPESTNQPQSGQQAEAPLSAIQLSPQRMQTIGVQLGQVELKPVTDELRFFGNVQANERRLARSEEHTSELQSHA